MTSPRIGHIARIALNVRDLDRAIAFYTGALAFVIEARSANGARLALGSEWIELILRPDGAPYPQPRAANDPWFQHFAIAVADMAAAYERLARVSPEPITRGGPQLLPPSTGSVTAYKFRDPDGHPLELSYAPASDWARLPNPGGAVFLGIDHTALAVRSLAPSIAFYTGLGFRLGAQSLNEGPEQARLDGLDDAVVDIVTLLTPEPGPHVELLHYRSPGAPAVRECAEGDIAATQTLLAPSGPPASGQGDAAIPCLRDPDGHLLRLTA
ncbi:VOC family protein [Sphingomonas bacterium]|uniref:VOC family protein n=1 Tax=Sphingomonas bacterium TaxID=1895847 RepID=UPI001576948F|nr:VOC family protein [Sphingomonas bacterium]